MIKTSSETTFLGPAQVLDTDGARVLVAMPDQKAWATPAMPYSYAAEPGDTLLVIGQDELFYVIGVIAGATRSLRGKRDCRINNLYHSGRFSLIAGFCGAALCAS